MSEKISERQVLALSGGVGGAKLALGLAQQLPPEVLTVVANTGDDFDHLGFPVSPDLDTLMYTLAGLNDVQQGWGLADESWQFIAALRRLGGDDWFQLGDRDLATHVMRRQWLSAGDGLQQVTAKLCAALGVAQCLLPMSDDPVRTQVLSDDGWLDFQDYFVRQQCRPEVTAVRFLAINSARPAPLFDALLSSIATMDGDTGGGVARESVEGVIICPSNPFVSIDPILALPTVSDRLRQRRVPVVAVSPIIDGRAIKGPTAKMMAALAMPVTSVAIAEHYRGLIDGLVIDCADQALAEAIEALGISVLSTPTLMESVDDKRRLAGYCLRFLSELREG